MYFSLAKSFYQAPLNKYLFTIANMSTSGEITDGERLKLKFAELKSQKGISKAEFARLTKFPGGASMVSQNVSNHKPISLAGAKAYALGFDCSIEEISPSLAASLPREDGSIALPSLPADIQARLAKADAATLRLVEMALYEDDEEAAARLTPSLLAMVRALKVMIADQGGLD